ncbi:MAG: hypothetical protein RJQ21_12075 [Rhodospirillales bacterium]
MTEADYLASLAPKGYGEAVGKTWEPGLLNDTHTHDVALYLYIRQGAMTLDVGAGAAMLTTACGPGDVIEVPAGVAHVERVGPGGVSFLVARK